MAYYIYANKNYLYHSSWWHYQKHLYHQRLIIYHFWFYNHNIYLFFLCNTFFTLWYFIWWFITFCYFNDLALSNCIHNYNWYSNQRWRVSKKAEIGTIKKKKNKILYICTPILLVHLIINFNFDESKIESNID